MRNEGKCLFFKLSGLQDLAGLQHRVYIPMWENKPYWKCVVLWLRACVQGWAVATDTPLECRLLNAHSEGFWNKMEMNVDCWMWLFPSFSSTTLNVECRMCTFVAFQHQVNVECRMLNVCRALTLLIVECHVWTSLFSTNLFWMSLISTILEVTRHDHMTPTPYGNTVRSPCYTCDIAELVIFLEVAIYSTNGNINDYLFD